MQTPIVRKRWAIADGYIPSRRQRLALVRASHETVCILHTTDRNAHEEITSFYTHRAPVGVYHLVVPACRTKQVWFNAYADLGPLPPAIDYANVLESYVPHVLQYLLRDSRLAENALVSTIAYACDEDE